MSKNQLKNLQSAQGMVEFALVLPILLLVILGIFAFGHLFFAYSSVVSASREAARWGAAAGVSGSSIPRYSDCPSIRAAAVRTGLFAGVNGTNISNTAMTSGIYVGFDHGPNDPNPDFDDCSDNTGPASAQIGYGDRIKVRVVVDYHPIVPLVNIPSFPLVATTARTIIKSVPVGNQPTAVPICPSTQVIIEFQPLPWPPPQLPYEPVVGQPIDALIRVTASDGTSPTGTVDLHDVDNPQFQCHNVTAGSTGVTCHLVPQDGYLTAATHYFDAIYTPTGCYKPSELRRLPLTIIPAPTIIRINSINPTPAFYGDTTTPLIVSFTVTAANPGGGIPGTGNVIIQDERGTICTAVLGGTNVGSCTFYPGMPKKGTTMRYYAYYMGNANYAASTNSDNYMDKDFQLPATFTPTITMTLPPAATRTPTQTSTPPPTCPSLVGGFDYSVTNALQFQVQNNGTNSAITRIDVTWPALATSALQEVRFGPLANLTGSCTSIQGGKTVVSNNYCIWETPNFPLGGEMPPQTALNSSTDLWNKTPANFNSGTWLMRLNFDSAPPQQNMKVSITFDLGQNKTCVLNVP